MMQERARKISQILPAQDRREEDMVRSEGFEPPTYWFVANCSIQLS